MFLLSQQSRGCYDLLAFIYQEKKNFIKFMAEEAGEFFLMLGWPVTAGCEKFTMRGKWRD